eukprot:3698569-Rhodomonas_salina.3
MTRSPRSQTKPDPDEHVHRQICVVGHRINMTLRSKRLGIDLELACFDLPGAAKQKIFASDQLDRDHFLRLGLLSWREPNVDVLVSYKPSQDQPMARESRAQSPASLNCTDLKVCSQGGALFTAADSSYLAAAGLEHTVRAEDHEGRLAARTHALVLDSVAALETESRSLAAPGTHTQYTSTTSSMQRGRSTDLVDQLRSVVDEQLLALRSDRKVFGRRRKPDVDRHWPRMHVERERVQPVHFIRHWPAHLLHRRRQHRDVKPRRLARADHLRVGRDRDEFQVGRERDDDGAAVVVGDSKGLGDGDVGAHIPKLQRFRIHGDALDLRAVQLHPAVRCLFIAGWLRVELVRQQSVLVDFSDSRPRFFARVHQVEWVGFVRERQTW